LKSGHQKLSHSRLVFLGSFLYPPPRVFSQIAFAFGSIRCDDDLAYRPCCFNQFVRFSHGLGGQTS